METVPVGRPPVSVAVAWVGVPSGVDAGAATATEGPAIRMNVLQSWAPAFVGPEVSAAARSAQFWTASPAATGPPALSGLMMRPEIVGAAVGTMPAAAWPNSQRTRVTYSPAPRPGGG